LCSLLTIAVFDFRYGTTYEEIEREGVKGKGAILLIGWESRDEHMAFRDTDVRS
jgi:hypothetical protein